MSQKVSYLLLSREKFLSGHGSGFSNMDSPIPTGSTVAALLRAKADSSSPSANQWPFPSEGSSPKLEEMKDDLPWALPKVPEVKPMEGFKWSYDRKRDLWYQQSIRAANGSSGETATSTVKSSLHLPILDPAKL